ncbi:hypothetical protein F5Y18DRAFT_428098 [Xylariaceae sp. FL1019]|nr:hypothetical protein F5Y18DRAFT_428098 [Xylariaceae sp. FL1019]
MEHPITHEQLHMMLWESLQVQLEPHQPFIKLTELLAVHLGQEGRQFLGEKLSYILHKPTEFIRDGYDGGRLFLANRHDLAHYHNRQVYDIPQGISVLLMPAGQQSNHLHKAVSSPCSVASNIQPGDSASIASQSAFSVSALDRSTVRQSISTLSTPGDLEATAAIDAGLPTSMSLSASVPISRSFDNRADGIAADPRLRRQLAQPIATHENDPSKFDPITGGKILRPPNSWCLFIRDMTPEILKLNPGWDATKINSHLGPVWNSMTDAQQKPWVDRAGELQRLHMVKYPDYWSRGGRGKRSLPTSSDNDSRAKKRKLIPATDLSDDRMVALNMAIQMSNSASVQGQDADRSGQIACGSDTVIGQQTTTAQEFNTIGAQETTNPEESSTTTGQETGSAEDVNNNNDQGFDLVQIARGINDDH